MAALPALSMTVISSNVYISKILCRLGILYVCYQHRNASKPFPHKLRLATHTTIFRKVNFQRKHSIAVSINLRMDCITFARDACVFYILRLKRCCFREQFHTPANQIFTSDEAPWIVSGSKHVKIGTYCVVQSIIQLIEALRCQYSHYNIPYVWSSLCGVIPYAGKVTEGRGIRGTT